MNRILTAIVGASAALVMTSGLVFAQDPDPVEVSLSQVSAQNDDTVEIEFDFKGNGASQAFGGTNINYDPAGIDDIDLSNCLDGNDATIMTSCTFPANGDHTGGQIRITLASQAPLGDFTGKIVFELDGTLSEDDVINLEWSDLLAEGPDADVEGTDGSITILAGPQSELDVDPDSHNFGTVDLGNLPQTQVFTATNNGDAGSTLEISAITQSGDSEIDLTANDNCTGVTLNAGDTCDFEVEFNATANGTYSADFEVVSDADSNAIITVNVAGEADSVADFDVTFSGGLGSGNPGDTLTETGLIENNGSADGDVSCSLTGDAEISIDPDPFSVTIPAGESASFDVICEIPSSASEGDSYNSTLTCEEVGGTVIYGDDIGCSVRAAAPAVPVPTMQSWGIALFSLIMLAIGGLSIRAFRS